MDGQLVELVNTHSVIESILEASLDVAMPIRDDGVDLICYRRKGDGAWISAPIQVKSRFDIRQKYLQRLGLLMCYVCSRDKIYVLTHTRAMEIAKARGYLNTEAWTVKEGYSCTVGLLWGKNLSRTSPHPNDGVQRS